MTSEVADFPIHPETMYSELEAAIKILSKWHEKVGKGIPGFDLPAEPHVTHKFMREMCGELMLVASKCSSLSTILQE